MKLGKSLNFYWWAFPLGRVVLHNSWVGVNFIALVASLLLPLGLIGLHAKLHARGGILGPIGFILAFFGWVFHASLQFDETFTWPIIGAHAAILIGVKGPMFTNPAFILAYLLMGVLFIVGYILINIDAIVKGELPRTASLCMLVDAPLFGLGIFAPMVVRTIGLVLFAISLCWSGLVICKESISSKQKT